MLGRSTRPQPQAAMNTWGDWDSKAATPTKSGQRVSQDTATQLLAVYGSASLITDQVSTLPVDVVNGQRPTWVDQPTDDLDRVSWMGQIAWSILMAGNAYLNVRLGRNGDIVALDPLDPERCEVRRVEGRKGVFVDGLPRPSVKHIPGRMRPGDLVGMSPVEWCRQSIGMGLAAQEYGAEFFGSGAGDMPGVIEIPKVVASEKLGEIAKQWQKRRQRGGRGLPGVLDDGATWKASGVTNEQAQFLETRKFTSSEIAGQMFLLDPSELGIPVDGTSMTYQNHQQRTARRIEVALMPLIRRIEPALTSLLDGGLYRFDVDSRLRGNTKESYETLALGLAAGFLTIDEVREILGLPPRPDMSVPATPKEIAEMIQKIYLGVGVVVTADEARDVLNSAGASLPAGIDPGGTNESI